MDRQGIEIFHCPDCRGVWLERDELDKLLSPEELTTVGSYGYTTQGKSLTYDNYRQNRRNGSLINEIFDF